MSGITLETPTKMDPLELVWQGEAGGHVIDMAWDPHGGRLAAAAADGPVTIFNLDGALYRPLEGHRFGTMVIAWSSNGNRFSSAGQDGRIIFWDLENGQSALELEGGASWVEHLAWNQFGGRKGIPNMLASAAGRRLRLWDENGKLIRQFEDHPQTISSIAWKPDSHLLSTSTYGRLALFAAGQETPQRQFHWKGSILKVCWSPNGKFVATGDQDSTVHFWFEKTGRDLQMSGYPTKVRELSWNATSRYLATGGGIDVTIWDCLKSPEGSRPIVLKGHDKLISALAFQNRGDLLASAGEDGRIIIWNPHLNRRGLQGMAANSPITRISWSPNDQLLAVGTASGAILVFASPG